MINGNEPAHPHGAWGQQTGIGLTKREYFAAKALQGLLTKYNLNKPEDQQIVSQMSVELSESLIKELNK